ncbi:hypothetical protein M758_12G021300 [Ceratodon purpureus]|nr:hypothetical protein M758_12G021300 [Ceratodon purpureus]
MRSLTYVIQFGSVIRKAFFLSRFFSSHKSMGLGLIGIFAIQQTQDEMPFYDVQSQLVTIVHSMFGLVLDRNSVDEISYIACFFLFVSVLHRCWNTLSLEGPF